MSLTVIDVSLFSRIRPFGVSPVKYLRLRNYSADKRLKSSKPKQKKAELAFPPKFAQKIQEWPKMLQLEIEEVANQVRTELKKYPWPELLRRGIAAGNLSVSDQYDSVSFGRMIELKGPDTPDQMSRRFRPGSPMLLCSEDGVKKIAETILLSCQNGQFLLKIRNGPSFIKGNAKYTIIPSESADVLCSLKEFLSKKSSWSSLPGGKLVQYAYRALQLPSIHCDPKVNCYLNLNDDQKRAVAAALNQKRPIVTIQGPPGTGKTAVITEIILQAIRRKKKVLVCAPSNLAVDNIMDRMNGTHFSRIGLTSSHSLDSEIENHKMFNALYGLQSEISELRSQRTSSEIRNMSRTADTLLRQIKMDIASNKQVIFSTISSGAVLVVRKLKWFPDFVIIDEAAQAMECATWIPLLNAPRCVLVGDPSQLPSTILSKKAESDGLGISLMEVLINEYGSLVNHMLRVQYRMNEHIMSWSNNYFYSSELKADKSVANMTLCDINDLKQSNIMSQPLLMIDTSSAKGLEECHQKSFRNEFEACIVIAYVQNLLAAGLKSSDIGVISPYDAQVGRLRETLGVDMVNSVDGYQGQERNVIVMSLVRNNKKGSDGRLSFWDKDARTKLKTTDFLGAPVTRAVIHSGGQMMAYALGYDWSKGHEGYNAANAKSRIFLKACDEEMKPKQKK
ncbi:hypothetical protein AB6A40_005838 [Gnathostoma spinigerum]|uniref:Helicase ATP-binding domain-containing protein n=1 Tax=Gnathostoma spinigerum TaxID=75299 RepID=A0ABD6EP99_9BILA